MNNENIQINENAPEQYKSILSDISKIADDMAEEKLAQIKTSLMEQQPAEYEPAYFKCFSGYPDHGISSPEWRWKLADCSLGAPEICVQTHEAVDYKTAIKLLTTILEGIKSEGLRPAEVEAPF